MGSVKVFYWFFAVICGLISILYIPAFVIGINNYLNHTNVSGHNNFLFAQSLLPFLLALLILNSVFLNSVNNGIKLFIRISLIIITVLVTTGIFVGISSYWGGYSGGGVNQLIAFAIAFPFLGLLVTTVVMLVGELSANNKNLI